VGLIPLRGAPGGFDPPPCSSRRVLSHSMEPQVGFIPLHGTPGGFCPPPWSLQDMIPKRCAGGTCIGRSLGHHVRARRSDGAGRDVGSCERSLGIPRLQRGRALGSLSSCHGSDAAGARRWDGALQPRGAVFAAPWSRGQPSSDAGQRDEASTRSCPARRLPTWILLTGSCLPTGRKNTSKRYLGPQWDVVSWRSFLLEWGCCRGAGTPPARRAVGWMYLVAASKEETSRFLLRSLVVGLPWLLGPPLVSPGWSVAAWTPGAHETLAIFWGCCRSREGHYAAWTHLLAVELGDR